MTQKQSTKLQEILATAHRNYSGELNNYAFFKVHDRTVSEDLVQDTFIKTWVYLVKKGKIDIMKAFLYHVLNDLVVDEYRKKKTSSLDVLVDKGFDPGINDSERLFNVLDGEKAILLIKRLPQKYQRIMCMRYVQFLSLKEMAFVVGQSKNAIAVQVHRGLEKLKTLYNHPISSGHVYASNIN